MLSLLFAICMIWFVGKFFVFALNIKLVVIQELFWRHAGSFLKNFAEIKGIFISDKGCNVFDLTIRVGK